MTGSAVITGGAEATTALAALGAAAVPSGLVEVTSTRTRSFSSAWVSTYVGAVAPVMLVQVTPSGERCHW
jgi:hypothetical protein